MSKVSPSAHVDIAEHSICHPGRPYPQGESQPTALSSAAFHRTKSLDRASVHRFRLVHLRVIHQVFSWKVSHSRGSSRPKNKRPHFSSIRVITNQQFFYHTNDLINVGGCPGFLVRSDYRQRSLIFVHGSDIRSVTVVNGSSFSSARARILSSTSVIFLT